MNVEIGAEAAQFPEKEYINGIGFAVYKHKLTILYILHFMQQSYIQCTLLSTTQSLSEFFCTGRNSFVTVLMFCEKGSAECDDFSLQFVRT
jgi:hypothetical protein